MCEKWSGKQSKSRYSNPNMRMKYIYSLWILFVFIRCAYGGQYKWEETAESLALISDGKIVWRSNHALGEGKPSIHPLGLIDGTTLTAFRPADHPWHRGLWFAWKFINGVNYWEERHDGQAEGRTEVRSVDVKKGFFSRSAKVCMDIAYHLPNGADLITEKRTIKFSKPRRNGYWVEWESNFKVGDQDVVLDRTALPGEPGGTWFGGYTGFSLRTARETLGWKFQNSTGFDGDDRIHGQPARWVSFSGQTVNGKNASLVIFDYPSNPRYPSHWYVSEKMPYFSPGILYPAPLILKAGEEFTLKYMVLVIEGTLREGEIEKVWADWANNGH